MGGSPQGRRRFPRRMHPDPQEPPSRCPLISFPIFRQTCRSMFAEAEVLDTIVGFHLHRGILALGARVGNREMTQTIASLRKNRSVVAGCGLSNHDKYGRDVSKCRCFHGRCGVSGHDLLRPAYRKALRVSVGSVLSVRTIAAVMRCPCWKHWQSQGFESGACHPQRGPRSDRSRTPRAWLSLSAPRAMACLPSFCRGSIPPGSLSSPQLDSLNAARRSGLALYHMASVMGPHLTG